MTSKDKNKWRKRNEAGRELLRSKRDHTNRHFDLYHVNIVHPSVLCLES